MKNPLLLLAIAVVLCVPATAGAANALPMLNAQRAYFGFYELQPDGKLQAEAQRRADELARVQPRPLRHLAGRRAGRYEGIGRRRGNDLIGRRFFTCGQNHLKFRKAGAATAVGGNQTFDVLIMGN